MRYIIISVYIVPRSAQHSNVRNDRNEVGSTKIIMSDRCYEHGHAYLHVGPMISFYHFKNMSYDEKHYVVLDGFPLLSVYNPIPRQCCYIVASI